ncbi:S9 family peptidase [Asticcacaulis sp. BYS171W]|uniref:S9 family peptidase n=1 Tax=Asticcacaulis aquaticus TaxID=2984212 RepID=A0ABT5HPW3_9CAUL|nr:S9 family peptidase [Asticcacaulis aquaticus]MDC7681998.1 S9 family peptidase [Asticcacaulis aquaticus]
MTTHTQWRLDRRTLLSGLTAGLATALTGTDTAQAAASSTPPALSVYGRLPDMAEVVLSPDGKRVALVKNMDGQRIVVDFELATGVTKFMSVGKMKVRDLMWADNDRLFLLSSQAADLAGFAGDKNEFSTGQILDVRANKAFLLFKDMPGFYPIVMGDFNRIVVDGQARFTAANVRFKGEGLRSLYSFDTIKGAPKLLDEDDHPIDNWVVRPDGTLMARAEHDPRTKAWSLFYRTTGWKKLYSEVQAIDNPSLVGRGRDDESLLIYFNAGPNAGRYCEISAAGVVSEPLDLPGDNVSPIFHPATRKLAGFISRHPNGNEYKFYDRTMERISVAIEKALEGSHAQRVASRADDPKKVIVYTEGPGDPGSYVYIDFATGEQKLVGETRPNLPSDWVADKQRITYKAADGLEIHGYLTLPPAIALNGRAAKNLPLVVLPHGGPQSYDNIAFDWMSQAFASRGYAVLQPNFRGSDGYGTAFVEKGYGEWGRKMQTDLSDGVRYLAAQGTIDPKRVAIAGASYGGYAALAGVTLDPGIYRCSVAIAGVSNLKAMIKWEFAETGRRQSSTILYWRRFMGNEALWDAVSPELQAAKADAPILLIHGKDDDVVPLEQSTRMREALQKAGKTVEMITLAGEDHWLTTEATRIQTLEAMLTFIQTHNPA